MHFSDLRTPAILVDVNRLRNNIRNMQAAAGAAGLRLRPHAKTHKSPVVARWQIEAGAVGVCCAKLGEAEVFADAGIADIRIPYPLNPVNGDRMLALAERVSLSFIVDDAEVAQGWSDVACRAGRRLDVLVKVDVGFHRCGIDPDAANAGEIVSRIAAMNGLRFKGLLSHAGHAYAASTDAETEAIAVQEARTLLDVAARAGVDCEEISVGATPTARYSARLDGITELRPGNYAYYDRMQVGIGSAGWEDCALTVLARVVSRPARDRLIFDSGSKTLTNDLARGRSNSAGHGAVLEDLYGTCPVESLVVERLSEEHATVRDLTASSPLGIGDLVRIIPNHSCVVSNMVDAVWLVDGDTVLDRLPVAARGRIT